MSDQKNQIETHIHVEFEDVDAYRIVHHTKMITYLERGRVRFFQKYNFNIVIGNFSIVLHKLNIRFVNPAKFLEDLIVIVSLKSADQSSIKLNYRIQRGKELLVKASSELACIDSRTHKITFFPDTLLEQFSEKL